MIGHGSDLVVHRVTLGIVQSSAISTAVPVAVVSVTGSQLGAWFGGGWTVRLTVAGAEGRRRRSRGR